MAFHTMGYPSGATSFTCFPPWSMGTRLPLFCTSPLWNKYLRFGGMMQALYHQKLAISFTFLKFLLFILNVLILLNIFLSPTQFTTLKKIFSFGCERANTLANLAHISRINKTEFLWGQGISFLRVLMFQIFAWSKSAKLLVYSIRIQSKEKRQSVVVIGWSDCWWSWYSSFRQRTRDCTVYPRA